MKQMATIYEKKMEYRLEGKGPTILILDGGHISCDTFQGYQKVFLENGFQILVLSRPGYGQTPSVTGKTTEDFADEIVHLLDDLKIDQVRVIGISAGGRTATQLASRHPKRVQKLILLSALGHDRWPASKRMRSMSFMLFNPVAEKVVWSLVRYFLKRNRQTIVKGMVGSLTTLKPEEVMKKLSEKQIKEIIQYFQRQRSGSGFVHDLRQKSGDCKLITASTLIIHSKYDGVVDVSHAEYLFKHIRNSELYLSEAEHHLLWFSSEHENIQRKIDQFLGEEL